MQLVFKGPRLQDSQTIEQSHRAQQHTPRSEDDQPGPVPAIRIVTIIVVDGTIGRERSLELRRFFPGHSRRLEGFGDVSLPVGGSSGCLGEP